MLVHPLRLATALAIALAAACSATGGSNSKPGGSGATGNGGGGGASASGGSGAGGSAAGGASGSIGIDAGPPDKCGNGLDDNGNGLVDEGCPCKTGETQKCWSGPPSRRNVGACKDGVQACQSFGEFMSWGPCVGEVLPSAEVPGNGIDEDCNGSDPGGQCVPSSSTEVCGSGKDDDCNGLQDCQDPACASVCNCSQEVCNDGKDNDCDKLIDCKDPDCVQAPNCQPTAGCTPQFPYFVEVACGDGQDNDCDGKTDCDDPDCKTPGQCGCATRETSCTDGKNDDCDKFTDCGDADCETCAPGSTRYCDDPTQCYWGKQTCGPDGHWGQCTETTDRPGNCSGDLYSADCCVNAGACCQNYPTDESSIGNCPGVTTCK